MKDNIHMILDSVSCVTETNLINDPRIHLIRMIARLEGREWYDGDISAEETVTLIEETGKLPTTSQPPLGEILYVFNELAEAGKKLFFITVSSGLSGTYDTACLAAKQVMKAVPGADIRVIDSKNGGLLATDATRLLLEKIDAGCEDMDELEAYAKDLLSRGVAYFVVDTLDYLQKGGRIGRASALVGGLLGVRPILSLDEEGKVIPVDKRLSRKKVLQRLIELAASHTDLEKICVHGSMCEEDVQFVANQMAKLFPNVDVETCSLGTVLLIHLGPGVLGLFVRLKAKK